MPLFLIVAGFVFYLAMTGGLGLYAKLATVDNVAVH
jgi:hypothetical protein